MITSLSAEQEAKLATYRENWLRIGLDCAPFERGRAEAAVREAYRCAGLKEPRIFIHLDSPMRGAIGAEFLKNWRAQVGDQVGAQVWAQVRAQVVGQVRDQVRAQVVGQVRDQVGDQVGDQVRAQVGGQVRDQVWDQVWDQVRAQVVGQVWAQVWAQVRAQVGAQVWDQVRAACYGQHDAGWLSFYGFFRDACSLSVCDKLSGLMAAARECGWWWPFADAAIITPKPRALHRDDRGRLHCETGPALVYPDGWGIWAIHGVRVPQSLIEQPESITTSKIEEERNAEVRRVMIDRYGQSRYLIDSGAKRIQSDDYGALYRKEIKDDEPLLMVKVVNSTAEPDGTFRDYFLRVPPTVKTAREGVAWSFGKTEAEYAPAIQT